MDNIRTYKGIQLPASLGKSYLILFIIWPFLAFLFAVADYTRRESKMVVFFYLVYFGLTMVSDADIMASYRYVETFRFFGSVPFRCGTLTSLISR